MAYSPCWFISSSISIFSVSYLLSRKTLKHILIWVLSHSDNKNSCCSVILLRLVNVQVVLNILQPWLDDC